MDTGSDIIRVFQVGLYDQVSVDGIRRVVYAYAQALKHDFDSQVVSMVLDNRDGYQQIEDDGVLLHRFGKASWRGLSLPPRLLRWLETVPKQSVFHLHGVFNPANFQLARALNRLGLPYIYTPHDSYTPASLHKNYLLKQVYIQVAEKAILRDATIIHALTDDGLRHIRKYTDNEIVLIPNFVIEPGTPGPAADHRDICYVGRLDVYQKGIDIMLKAFQKYRATHDAGCRFILIGVEDKSISLAELHQMVADLGLEVGQDVIFTGEVSEARKVELLANCRVYFQLSRFEGFGMSVVEALAMGVPVLISPHIPIAESIARAGGGRVATSADQAAQILSEMLDLPPDAYAASSQAARQTYLANYHPDIIKAQLTEVYLRAVQQRAPVRA